MKALFEQKRYQVYQEYLYPRGYLITDHNIDLSVYPFYRNWNAVPLYRYRVYVHIKQQCFINENEGKKFFIIGHCYNPFSGEKDENIIVRDLAEHYISGGYFEYLNQLTGNFVTGYEEKTGQLCFTCDATGMLTAYYGKVENYFYVSCYSHLIGDVCNLQFDLYVKKLVNYRFYRLFGKMLPGDMSAYENIRHVIPNFQIIYENGTIVKKRFWPTEAISTDISQAEYDEKIKFSAEILHNSLRLISEKWPGKAAISLTGGCDSKTTLACAEGLYDRYNYFSYISSEAEKVDAEAAEKICHMLGLKHKTYRISESDHAFKDIEIWTKGTIKDDEGAVIGTGKLEKIDSFKANFQFKTREYIQQEYGKEIEASAVITCNKTAAEIGNILVYNNKDYIIKSIIPSDSHITILVEG